MSGTAEILLVEDNRGDAVLLRSALEASGWRQNLSVVGDGVVAMDFLRRRNGHATAPRPDVILLDLNLPRMSGLEVLREIKSDPALAGIPAFVFSGSHRERGAVQALGLPGDRYFVKPLAFEGYVEAVKRIELIWREATGGGGA